MVLLWARIMRKQRVTRSETVELEGELPPALGALCAKLDIPRPVLLGKHQREWAQFRQTRFVPDDFVESVPFDRLEIERVDTQAQRAKSQDPRNG